MNEWLSCCFLGQKQLNWRQSNTKSVNHLMKSARNGWKTIRSPQVVWATFQLNRKRVFGEKNHSKAIKFNGKLNFIIFNILWLAVVGCFGCSANSLNTNFLGWLQIYAESQWQCTEQTTVVCFGVCHKAQKWISKIYNKIL